MVKPRKGDPGNRLGSVVVLRFCLIVFEFNPNLKSKNLKPVSPSKREPRSWQLPHLRTPRISDSSTKKTKKYSNNMPLILVNAAFITTAKPVAHWAPSHRIEWCCIFQNLCIRLEAMIAFEQRPYFSPAHISRLRTPAPLQQQTMVG